MMNMFRNIGGQCLVFVLYMVVALGDATPPCHENEELCKTSGPVSCCNSLSCKPLPPEKQDPNFDGKCLAAGATNTDVYNKRCHPEGEACQDVPCCGRIVGEVQKTYKCPMPMTGNIYSTCDVEHISK